MKKNLLLTVSASLLLIGSTATADFKAAGTAYTKHSVCWDARNKLSIPVSMPKEVIIKKE